MDTRIFGVIALAALGIGFSPAQGQEMQVEEPANLSAPPVDPDQDGGAWKAKSDSPALNRAERAAYEERRRKVEELTTQVRKRRQALENSEVGDRAARVKELENLVLEKAVGGNSQNPKRERLEKLLEKASQAREKALEKKLDKLERNLEKSLEKQKEKLDRKTENRQDKSNRKGAGN